MAKLNVIGQIYRAGSITPTELAAREGVKIQTLTRLLAELEAEGWLTRVPDASDGRQSLLSMTPLGKKRLAGASRASDALLARIIGATLSADERTLLLRACVLLEGLGEAFGSQPAGLVATSGARP
ncbi:MAG: MarR family transcriptional regulator [Rhodoferax sp.]